MHKFACEHVCKDVKQRLLQKLSEYETGTYIYIYIYMCVCVYVLFSPVKPESGIIPSG